MMKKILITFACWLLASVVFADGGDVPIDSPPGSTENIHWYMQDTVAWNIFEKDIPWWSMVELCNLDDPTLSCTGAPLRNPSFLLQKAGNSWINVSVQVDSRIPHPWRFATKQIRDTNRLFRRSGIKARLFITRLFTVDMVKQYNDDPDIAFDHLRDNWFSLTEKSGADLLLIMMDERVDRPTDYCGNATVANGTHVQIAVVNCAYDSYVVAHEFGHNFGLDHDASQPSSFSLVKNGIGYIEPENGCGSIMSYARCKRPFFSSPRVQVWVPELGKPLPFGNENANSVDAANSLVASLQYANEITHKKSQKGSATLHDDEESVMNRPLPEVLLNQGVLAHTGAFLDEGATCH